MFITEPVIYFFTGIVFSWFCNRIIRTYVNTERTEDLNKSKQLLMKYGMRAELYLPTLGIEDNELRELLDNFSYSGHIVIDKNNQLVGKLIPKVERASPKLRLVVSND